MPNMKTKILLFSLFFLPFLFFSPPFLENVSGSVFNGGGIEQGLGEVKRGVQRTGITTSDNFTLVVLGWVQFLLGFAGVFAFAVLVYAGFLYIAGFADEENVNKAKNIVINSAIGLVLIFSAYAIVATIIRASS